MSIGGQWRDLCATMEPRQPHGSLNDRTSGQKREVYDEKIKTNTMDYHRVIFRCEVEIAAK